MRQQRLGRHAAVDRPLRGRAPARSARLAGATAIARPAGHPHPHLGRDVVQHLRAVFADQRAARRRSRDRSLFLTSITCLDPRQLRRQRTAIALAPPRRAACARPRRSAAAVGIGDCRRIQRRRLLGHRLLQVLGALAAPLASSSCSERRPKRLRCKAATISRLSRSISASAAPQHLVASAAGIRQAAVVGTANTTATLNCRCESVSN